ncbi:MAG: hypothetical protein V4550_16385 [Gemmatimonadota bacterium]
MIARRLSFTALALALGTATIGMAGAPRASDADRAWIYRIRVSGADSGRVAFLAFTRGGADLVMLVSPGTSSPPRPWWGETPSNGIPTRRGPYVAELSPKDTLRARAPAEYSSNFTRGSITFVATGRERLHVVIGRNPYGAVSPVRASGRRLTLRAVGGSVVIDSL